MGSSSPPPPNPFAPPPPPPPTTAAGQCTASAPTVENGVYTVQHLSSSTQASLTCSSGYTPSTTGHTITCSNNVWQPAGSCVLQGGGSSTNPFGPSPPPPNPFSPQTCSMPAPVPAGFSWVLNSDGSTATMSCPAGSAVWENNIWQTTLTLSCLNGQWSPAPS